MTTTTNRRRHPRIDKNISAQVRFVAPAIKTETANISASGLYFVADGAVTVEVTLGTGKSSQTVRGRLVRVDSRTAAHDQLGFAIKLDESINAEIKKSLL